MKVYIRSLEHSNFVEEEQSAVNSLNELYHYGIKGMRWGVRRYQNEDGSLTNRSKKKMTETFSKTYKNVRELKKDFKLDSNGYPNFKKLNNWNADRDEAYKQLREHNIITDDDVQKQGKMEDAYNKKIEEVQKKYKLDSPELSNSFVLTETKTAKVLDELRDTTLKNLDTTAEKVFNSKDQNTLSIAKQELRKRIYKEYKKL